MNKEPLRDITEEDVRIYEEQGVACLRQVFDRDWIERMSEAADRVLARPGPTGLDLNPPGSEGRFFNENHIWTYDDDFRALLFESPVPYIAHRMLRSRKVNIVYDFLLVKEPRSPYPTEWHQDECGNPMAGPHIGGSWMPLEYTDLESGAVEFIKGSHRSGIVYSNPYETEHSDVTFFTGYAGEYLDPAREEDRYEPFPDVAGQRERYEEDIVHYDTEPGDFLFTSSRVLHWSPGNVSGRRRRAIGYRWAGDHSTYYRRTSPFRLLPPCNPKMAHDAPFPDGDHYLYPRVWPRPAHRGVPLLGQASEIARKDAGASAEQAALQRGDSA